MRLQWTTELSVRNSKIDNEHQRWIELFNNFYTGIAEGKTKERLEELILGMLDYTRYHFSSEETFMQSINYPNIQKHTGEHAAFIKKIEEFHQKFISGKLILSLEVTNFLKTWLVNHIKGSDMQYALFSEHNIKQPID